MLKGIRILDFTRLLPGPYATLILRAMGAEVIKIEDPRTGDYMRWMPPQAKRYSVIFDLLNRGKKSICLDLKHPKAREIIEKLVHSAHALMEQFRPGVMDRLGLGYAHLSSINPSLVYCSISGFGQSGPLAEKAGHDLNYIALAGILQVNANGNDHPVLPPVQMADLTGGLFAALGVLGGIIEAQRTGKGRYLDVAMMETALAFMAHHLAVSALTGDNLKPRGMELTGSVVCYNVYRTKDDRFITLAALEPKFWKEFIEATGARELAGEQFAPARDGEEAYEKVKALFASRTLKEWEELFQKFDACVAPSRTLQEVLNCPHLSERGMFQACAAEEGVTCTFPVIPPATPEEYRKLAPAPHPGQHTREILLELGYNEVQIQEFEGEGLIKNGQT